MKIPLRIRRLEYLLLFPVLLGGCGIGAGPNLTTYKCITPKLAYDLEQSGLNSEYVWNRYETNFEMALRGFNSFVFDDEGRHYTYDPFLEALVETKFEEGNGKYASYDLFMDKSRGVWRVKMTWYRNSYFNKKELDYVELYKYDLRKNIEMVREIFPKSDPFAIHDECRSWKVPRDVAVMVGGPARHIKRGSGTND